jgi:hypothetical protein
MQNETTYSGILGETQRFQAAMEASVSQIPHLEASRERLGEALTRAQEIARQQAAASAAKQELSLQLRTAMINVQLLATMLRKGVKQHYGNRSEKLAEFGLQPFRGRKFTAKAEVKKPVPAIPETSPEKTPAPSTA